MRGLSLLLLMGILALGCGEQGGGLSDEEFSLLRNLNQLQVDNSTAFEFLAVKPLNEGGTVSKRSDRLSGMLAGCDRDGRRPALRFDRTNKDEFAVGGGDCPVSYRQTQRYNVDTKEWFVYDVLTLQNGKKGDDYRDVAGLRSRQLRGSIVRQGTGDNYDVAGSFLVSAFETKNYGVVTAEIVTQQTFIGTQSLGNILVTVRSSDGWEHQGRIRWEERYRPIFTVNESEIGRGEFEELFSAYGVLEIMANGARMR